MKYLLLAALFGVAGAFSTGPAFARRAHRQGTILSYTPDDFEKAVECASEYGKCNVEELERLAAELDKFQDSCFFEKDSESCDKEVQDREDVAEVLRMQAELQLRTEYLKDANLFADDVQKERIVNEREDFVDNVLPALDG